MPPADLAVGVRQNTPPWPDRSRRGSLSPMSDIPRRESFPLARKLLRFAGRARRNWLERHQHPVSFWLHMVGIPLALLAIPALFFVEWYWCLGAFVLGYLLQFVGASAGGGASATAARGTARAHAPGGARPPAARKPAPPQTSPTGRRLTASRPRKVEGARALEARIASMELQLKQLEAKVAEIAP